MKQLLQGSGDGKTEVVDVPAPGPRSGRLLVRTQASLVSAGTERMVVDFTRKSLVQKARARPDLVEKVVQKVRTDGVMTAVRAARSRLAQPLALGYSAAGVVLDVGEGVSGYRLGDRVACAGAGYAVHAEVLSVPPNLATKIPDGVSFETGAFATVGAIGLHGLRLGEPQLGESVAVIGLGLIGLLTVQMVAAAGCKVIGFDLDPSRAALAVQLGARRAHAIGGDESPVSAVMDMTGGQGVDLALICASTEDSAPVSLAGEICRDRGRVVAIGAVGTEIPRRIYYDKELDFRISRSYGPGRYDPTYEEQGIDYPVGYVRWTEGRNLSAVLELAEDGQLKTDPLVTHRIPIDESPRAYEVITGAGEAPVLGVVLTYPRGESVGQGGEGPELPTRTVPISTPAPSTGALGIGVLGAGLFSTSTMLPAIKGLSGAHLVGICSAGGTSSHHAAQRFGAGYATTDPNQILEDGDVDIVAVLTRHDLHGAQVCAALEAGKSVFCEKPLCLTTGELESIQRALASSSGMLTVGFNRRFAPMAEELRDFLQGVGEPLVMNYRVNAGYLPLDHWVHDPAVGGGRMIGEGCHFIDFMSYLTGALPRSVSSAALPDTGRTRGDNVTVTIEFDDGSVGSLQYVAAGDPALGKERCEVFGGGRAAVLDDFRTLELVKDGRKKARRTRLEQDKGHRVAWARFVEAVGGGGPAPISLESLVATTKATFAAEAARVTGTAIRVTTAVRHAPELEPDLS